MWCELRPWREQLVRKPATSVYLSTPSGNLDLLAHGDEPPPADGRMKAGDDFVLRAGNSSVNGL